MKRISRRSFWLGVLLLSIVWGWTLAASEVEPLPGAEGGGPPEKFPTLVYVSDYFSFVGSDANGHVAFALDNNRGRDGERYQAEHFVVLHDEHRGWIEIAGSGVYENREKALLAIPDSDGFQFQGSVPSGFEIRSPKNGIQLEIQPLVERLAGRDGDRRLWMGSAPARLQWNDRTLEGRVIYEYLYLPEFNRLTRTYFGLWKAFQGFYLLVEGEGDFYLHSQHGEMLAPLVGTTEGFAVFDDQADRMEAPVLQILDRSWALGFYRWPVAWRIEWIGEKGPGKLQVGISDRRVLGNWVLGGFAMGIAQGEIVYQGKRWPFYGLVELLM